MLVLVGSANPVKLRATRDVLAQYFDDPQVVGIEVESGVPKQPLEAQVFEGAQNRVAKLREINEYRSLGAKLFVGIEGGLVTVCSKCFVLSAVCVVDCSGRTGIATSALFQVPPRIEREVVNGSELGMVIDRIARQENTGAKSGAVGLLTGGVIDRQSLYRQAITLALAPLLHDSLFTDVT